MKLGALDGLSPSQAAADAKYHIKLPAAIMVLQFYADSLHWSFDFNELRGRLGLPTLGPIEAPAGQVNQIPLVRLARVSAEKLSDEDLVQAFQRAVGYNHRPAVMKFGKEIIGRPSFAERKERALAYMTLARMEDDLDRALTYVEAGRRDTDATGKSHATWDLEELSLRFARQDIPEALQLIRHIESHAHQRAERFADFDPDPCRGRPAASRRHARDTDRASRSGNGPGRLSSRRTGQTLDPRRRIHRRRRKTLGPRINVTNPENTYISTLFLPQKGKRQ